MQRLVDPEKLDGCVLALGMFDGVHRGHQALIMRGRELRDTYGVPLTVCTFEPHPLMVFAPERAPKRLSVPDERDRLMEDMDVDILAVHTFTREVARTLPEDFLEELKAIYAPRAIVCGYNFTFGYRGQGTVDTLQTFGKANGIHTEVVDAVCMDGQPVSSTRIRDALEKGQIHDVSRLLGHAYSLEGRVVHGLGLGRTLGFATANVELPEEKALPRFGAYVAVMVCGDHAYPAMVNIGHHPTVPGGGIKVEAHAVDQELALYDSIVRLELIDFLRAETKFDGLEALKAQLQRDCAEVRTWFQQRSEVMK